MHNCRRALVGAYPLSVALSVPALVALGAFLGAFSVVKVQLVAFAPFVALSGFYALLGLYACYTRLGAYIGRFALCLCKCTIAR